MRYKNITFDDFIANNDKELEAKQKAEIATKEQKNVLMVGECGNGKTMLANCIVNKIGDSLVVTASKMGRVFRESVNDPEKKESELFKELIEYQYLIIDEVGTYKLTDYEYRILNEVIDMRYMEEKPTGIISNLDLKNLTDVIGERAIDRIKGDGGIFISFTGESKRK